MWPEGISNMWHRLSDELPSRSFLLAGAGIDTNDEHWQADTAGAFVDACTEATGDGIDVRGRFWSAFTDGYHHHRGWAPQVGLFDRARNPRSAVDAWRQKDA